MTRFTRLSRTSRLIQGLTWANIGLQLASPLAIAFTPVAIASQADANQAEHIFASADADDIAEESLAKAALVSQQVL